MANRYINTVQDGTVEYDIHDARINISSADNGKFLKVENGEIKTGTGLSYQDVQNIVDAGPTPTWINDNWTLINAGLSFSRGYYSAFVMGNVLYIRDVSTFSVVKASYSKNKIQNVWEFTMPKYISERLYTTANSNTAVGTIEYVPCLYYDEKASYQTLNNQVYLRRHAIGTTEDTFRIVYTGVENVDNTVSNFGTYASIAIPLYR